MALGIRLDPVARTAIDGHVRLLSAWNQAINLTAVRGPAAMAIRLVADSLTGLSLLRSRGVDRFIDLGSGGGFPGLTLAAALPADRALLVESIGKKVRFLGTAATAIGLADHVAAVNARAEDLAADRTDRGQWSAVTARAVAPLADLIELGLPFLRPGGLLIAWKRGPADNPAGLGGELATARRALAAIDPAGRIEVVAALSGGTPPPAILADLGEHCLVTVERGGGTLDPAWPRDPAARRRRPW